MAEVTLYHWEPNANSGKPMLALMEKGVPFVSRYTDMLQFDQHKPEYLAVNPQGTIPLTLINWAAKTGGPSRWSHGAG